MFFKYLLSNNNNVSMRYRTLGVRSKNGPMIYLQETLQLKSDNSTDEYYTGLWRKAVRRLRCSYWQCLGENKVFQWQEQAAFFRNCAFINLGPAGRVTGVEPIVVLSRRTW
jgi:hypothetical protein